MIQEAELKLGDFHWIVDQVLKHLQRPKQLAWLAKQYVFGLEFIAALALPVLVPLKDVHELDDIPVLLQVVQHQLAVGVQQGFQLVVHRFAEL